MNNSYQLLIGNKTDDNMYYEKGDSDIIYKINVIRFQSLQMQH